MTKEKESGATDEDMEEYEDYLDMMHEIETGEPNAGIAGSSEVYKESVDEYEKKKRFDSERIVSEIKEIERFIEKNGRNRELEKFRNDLKKYLEFQKVLEKKLEQIVFGEESAELPKGFLPDLEKGVKEYHPEIPENGGEAYFPVGIGREISKLPKDRMKPIDALVYLFWLQNQGRKSEIMVVDSMQETNYQYLYGMSQAEARQAALRNGAMDKNWYEEVIRTFGLNNVSIGNYQEIEQYSKTKECLELLEKLSGENSIFKEAFSRVVQKSVKDQDGESANKQKLLEQYGRTEIA
jgi:hypothetical protein